MPLTYNPIRSADPQLTFLSLRLWESLGFARAGLIPKAGRLKNDGGEEYVDAIIFYKSFIDNK